MASQAVTNYAIFGVVGGAAAGAAAFFAAPVGVVGALVVAGGAAVTVTALGAIDYFACSKLQSYVGNGLLKLLKIVGSIFLAAGVGGFALAAVLGFPMTITAAAIAGGSAALAGFMLMMGCDFALRCANGSRNSAHQPSGTV